MNIKIASTRTDAALIKALVDEFFVSLGQEPPQRTADRYRSNFGDGRNVWIVDTTNRLAALVRIDLDTQEVKIESLLPRGTARALLVVPLKFGLNQLLIAFPQAGGWRVWAEFYRAMDENGIPDNGRSECLAWQTEFPGATVYARLPDGSASVVTALTPYVSDARYWIEWTLGLAAAV